MKIALNAWSRIARSKQAPLRPVSPRDTKRWGDAGGLRQGEAVTSLLFIFFLPVRSSCLQISLLIADVWLLQVASVCRSEGSSAHTEMSLDCLSAT